MMPLWDWSADHIWRPNRDAEQKENMMADHTTPDLDRLAREAGFAAGGALSHDRALDLARWARDEIVRELEALVPKVCFGCRHQSTIDERQGNEDAHQYLGGYGPCRSTLLRRRIVELRG